MIFDFFRSKWVPCETCGVKVGLKEATDSVASFALSFVQIGKQEEVFRLEISHKVPYQLSSSIIMIGYEQESTLMALN